MREIRPSGSMSGTWKPEPQATATLLDSTDALFALPNDAVVQKQVAEAAGFPTSDLRPLTSDFRPLTSDL